MTIAVNDTIPTITLKHLTDEGMQDLNIADHIKGKTVILFGVPGAFTPSCDQQHLPGYIAKADDIKTTGIDEILCLSVNDPFVMDRWGDSLNADGKVTLLPDGNAELTKALGLDFDCSGFGLGTRCQRFSALVEDGKVISIDIEESPGNVDISSAEACLLRLAA